VFNDFSSNSQAGDQPGSEVLVQVPGQPSFGLGALLNNVQQHVNETEQLAKEVTAISKTAMRNSANISLLLETVTGNHTSLFEILSSNVSRNAAAAAKNSVDIKQLIGTVANVETNLTKSLSNLSDSVRVDLNTIRSELDAFKACNSRGLLFDARSTEEDGCVLPLGANSDNCEDKCPNDPFKLAPGRPLPVLSSIVVCLLSYIIQLFNIVARHIIQEACSLPHTCELIMAHPLVFLYTRVVWLWCAGPDRLLLGWQWLCTTLSCRDGGTFWLYRHQLHFHWQYQRGDWA
jgi:hypothetical protein